MSTERIELWPGDSTRLTVDAIRDEILAAYQRAMTE